MLSLIAALQTMRRSCAPLLVALCIATLAGCGAKSEAELLTSAQAHLADHELATAAIELKTALQRNPTSAEARYLLGETLLRQGDAAGALVELERARELGHDQNLVVPSLARALMANGQAKRTSDLLSGIELPDPIAGAELKSIIAAAYGAQGLLESSQAAVDAALQLNPQNLAARLLRARLSAGQGATDEALQLLDALIAENSGLREAWHMKGELLLIGKRDADGAVLAFRQALIAEPRHLASHEALLGIALANRDRLAFRAQVAELKSALPQHPQTQLYEAHVALLDNELDKARELVQPLLRAEADNARFLLMAGAIEARAGALVLAESHLNKAVQLSPGLGQARLLLARTQVRSGQPARALTTLAPVLNSQQLGRDWLSIAGEAHLLNGDAASAEAFFRRAAATAPDDPLLQTAIALAQIARGNSQAALARLETLADAGAGTEADLALISALLQRSDLDGALAATKRLQMKTPHAALPHQLEGRIRMQRNDAEGARASFGRALALDPVFFEAVAGLAAIDVSEGKPDQAQLRFEALLAQDNKSYRALLALASTRRLNGAPPQEIRKLLAEAVQTHPSEPAPRLMLIDNLLERGEAAAARTAAQEAVAALPDQPMLQLALGRAHLAAGDTQQAITTLNRLAAAHPRAPEPHVMLAEVHLSTRNHEAARQSLQRTLELAPHLLPAQQQLAQIHISEGRPDAAVALARTVQKQRPSESVGYLMEGQAQASARRRAEATAAFRFALERDRDPSTAARLHASLVAAGRATEAKRFAEGWLRDNPKDEAFRFHLGSVAIEQGELAQAEEIYRNVLTVNRDQAMALNNVAWLMLKQGKAGALEYADRASALMPDNATVMDTLAMALLAEGNASRALATQRETVARSPGVAVFELHLAQILLETGDRSEARAILTRLSRLGGRFDRQDEVRALLARTE
jgi:cellulose synthase operon protein C